MSATTKPESVLRSEIEVVVAQSLSSQAEDTRRNTKGRQRGGGWGTMETRIPRGKENLRVVRNVKLGQQDLRTSSVSGILTESSPEINGPLPQFSSSSTSTSTSELKPVLVNFLKPRAVPDIHQKLLQTIRLNKRKSLERQVTESQSPLRAPAPSPSQDRESPVSGSDLQMYLTGVFNMADKYKSGTVSAGMLLDCITSMVDLPRLDKWKLEELKRMLDPKNDNRYVDAASWCLVGQSWVEMMLNPGNYDSS